MLLSSKCRHFNETAVHSISTYQTSNHKVHHHLCCSLLFLGESVSGICIEDSLFALYRRISFLIIIVCVFVVVKSDEDDIEQKIENIFEIVWIKVTMLIVLLSALPDCTRTKLTVISKNV